MDRFNDLKENVTYCCIVICWFMQKYTYIHIYIYIYIYIYWIHTDAMIKTQEDFFIKIFTSHFIARVWKGLLKVCMREGSWRPNITEIFWPQSYGRQRCVFLVLLWTPIQSGLSRAPSAGCGFPYDIFLQLALEINCPPSVQFRPYITFKFPCGDIDTPPRLRNFFRYLAIGMCHFCYLWNCLCDRHRAEITVIQFTGHSLPVRQSMRV